MTEYELRKAVEDLLNGEEPSLDWVDDYLLNKNIKI